MPAKTKSNKPAKFRTEPKKYLGAKPTSDRFIVADMLAAVAEPVTGTEAAMLLGWSLDRWWNTVGTAEKWFRITGKGYILTRRGRQELVGIISAKVSDQAGNHPDATT